MYDFGWIKLHRKILNWQWYNDINVKVVFLHLLLTACYSSAGAYGFKLNAGQLITTRKKLSAELNLSEQQIRTALKKLEKSEDICIKSTNKFMLITVVNYTVYQDTDFSSNQQITNKQPANNQQITSKQPTSNQQATSLKKECNNIISEYNNNITINQSSDDSLIDYNNTLSVIKAHIDYDTYLSDNNSNISLIDDIISIICNVCVFYNDNKIITISDRDYPASFVKSRFFNNIDKSIIDIVVLIYNQSAGNIKNLDGYIISTLFNAVSQKSLYWDNKVKSDFH